MAKNVAAIRKEIVAVCSDAERVGVRVHRVALLTLNNYKAHGDTSLCAELVNGLRQKGIYRRALIDWFKKHGHMNVIKGNEGLIFTKDKTFDHKNTDIVKAGEDFFGKKDTDTDAIKSYDAAAVLLNLLKKDQMATDTPEVFRDKEGKSTIKSKLNDAMRRNVEEMIRILRPGEAIN